MGTGELMDTAEAILQRGAQATLNTVAAVQRRDAATEAGPGWRLTNFAEDVRRGTVSLADLSVQDALHGALIVLDDAGQGMPRSRLWAERAIQVLEQAGVDDGVEAERLEADLEHERELRAERQRRCDEALEHYVDLLQQERQPRPSVPTVLERLGRAFSVVDDQPAAELAPFRLGESEPRTSTNPRVKAYYAWLDLKEQVAAGSEDDRRVVKGASGSEVLIETAIVERLVYLKRLAGVRQSRLGQLHDNLARLEAPPPAPLRVLVRDDQGRETAGTLPARITSADIPTQPLNLVPRAY
jgi:hypothetical protein